MKFLFTVVLSISLVLSVCNLSVYARKEIRDSDGTLIMDQYPEVANPKRLKLRELYYQTQKGEVSQDFLEAKFKEFFPDRYRDFRDVKRENYISYNVQNIGRQDLSFTSLWRAWQVSQSKSYYCGPATAETILTSHRILKSQDQLAVELQTETWNGTPWYVSDTIKYIMKNVLDDNLGYDYHVVFPSPSATELGQKVKDNVDFWGNAIAANINISANHSSRPSCYPPNTAIAHWVALRGYANNGDYINWAEPAYNAPSVSWSHYVTEPYPYTTKEILASCVASRGIIW